MLFRSALGRVIADARAARGILRNMLRADSAAFLEGGGGSISLEKAGAGASKAWGAVKTLLAFGGASRWRRSKQLPCRARPDGTMAESQEEIAGLVLHHFAAIEAAEVTDWSTMAARHAGKTHEGGGLHCTRSAGPHIDKDIANVCDLYALRLSSAKARPGKACRGGTIHACRARRDGETVSPFTYEDRSAVS